MLDKNKEYGYRYADDWATWDVTFWHDSEDASWIRSERHCGFGEGDFWTDANELYVTEEEVLRELETCTEES